MGARTKKGTFDDAVRSVVYAQVHHRFIFQTLDMSVTSLTPRPASTGAFRRVLEPDQPAWEPFDYEWTIIGDPNVLLKLGGAVTVFYDDPNTWFHTSVPITYTDPTTYADRYPIAQ
jgi:hypothetical protein